MTLNNQVALQMVRISINADLQILFYNTWLIAQLIFQYQYANYTNPDYKVTGEASLKLQLINQRSDNSFALFTGGLSTVNPFSFFSYLFLEFLRLHYISAILHSQNSYYMCTADYGGSFKYSYFCKSKCTDLPTISSRKDVG